MAKAKTIGPDAPKTAARKAAGGRPADATKPTYTATVCGADAPAEQLLRVGDLVRLRSGGPRMTIVGPAEVGIECAWFVHGYTDDIRREAFPADALVRW